MVLPKNSLMIWTCCKRKEKMGTGMTQEKNRMKRNLRLETKLMASLLVEI
jgi:hypothetical protein